MSLLFSFPKVYWQMRDFVKIKTYILKILSIVAVVPASHSRWGWAYCCCVSLLVRASVGAASVSPEREGRWKARGLRHERPLAFTL